MLHLLHSQQVLGTFPTLSIYTNANKDFSMVGIGFEAVRIALNDAVERQQAITELLQKSPEQTELLELAKEQSELLKKTLSLFNRII
jgi:hypothetical protein